MPAAQTLTQQRQAVEAAQRFIRDGKKPRPSETATILAGLAEAATTLRFREIQETRI